MKHAVTAAKRGFERLLGGSIDGHCLDLDVQIGDQGIGLANERQHLVILLEQVANQVRSQESCCASDRVRIRYL